MSNPQGAYHDMNGGKDPELAREAAETGSRALVEGPVAHHHVGHSGGHSHGGLEHDAGRRAPAVGDLA